MKRIVEKTERHERIDPDTGEIVNSVETVVIGSPRRPMDMNFVKIFPAFFSSFLEQLKIDDGKARLALYFIYMVLQQKSDGDNVVAVSNADVMDMLGISKPTAIRYIGDLIDLGLISRITPRSPVYKVNPEMIYKGTLTKYFNKMKS